MMTRGQSLSQEAHQYVLSNRDVAPTRIMMMPKMIPPMGNPFWVPKHRSSSLLRRYTLPVVGRREAPQLLHTRASSSFSAPHFEQ